MAEDLLRIDIRSVLQSSDRPILARNLMREYKLLIGDDIPYKSLGFNSLEYYLKSIPDVVRLSRNSTGEVVCEAVKTEDTKHLVKLVSGQKKSRKPTVSSRPPIPAFRKPRNPPSNCNNNVSRPPRKTCAQNCSYVEGSNSHSVTQTNPSSFSRYEVPPRFQKVPDRSAAAAPSQDAPECMPKSTTARSKTKTVGTGIKAELETFVKAHDLGEVTAKVLSSTIEGRVRHLGVVKIGNRTFSSYPSEKESRDEAVDEAFKCALEELKNLLSGSTLVDNLPVSSQINIIRRALEILSGKRNGLFTTYFSNIYSETYNEQLPLDWLSHFVGNIYFQIDKVDNSRTILRLNTSQQDYSVRRSSVVSDGSVLSENSTSSESHLSGNSLCLPADNYWNVYVTVAKSTTDVYVRLVGDEYSSRYEELAIEMDLHYMTIDDNANSNMPDVVVGNLYAAKADAGWHRVEIVKVLPNDLTQCCFVDHGDVDLVPVSKLWVLQPQFRSLQFQAVHCQLYGLESFSNIHVSMNLFEIVGKSFVAQVVSREETISLVLFDTSTEEDININDQLSALFMKEIQPPKLKIDRGICDVSFTHVTTTGDVFLQIKSPTFDLLEKLIDDAALNYSPSSSRSSVEQGSLYLAKYAKDGQWYRAVALPGCSASEGQIEMYFVDYGRTDVVAVDTIIPLTVDHDSLIKFPHQAVRCRLHNVPSFSDLCWSERTSYRLFQLVPDDHILIAKVFPSINDTEVPQVELFKRIQPGNELVSVNQTLDLDSELFSKRSNQVKVNSSAKRSSEGKRVSSGSPKKTVVPKASLSPSMVGVDILTMPFPSPGKLFDVHITLAPHPFNFVIQPWVGGEVFDQLMLDMHAFYNKTKDHNVSMSDVIDDGLYAMNEKDVWYRVRIQFNEGLKDINMVSAFFIDYGDHTISTINCLRLLDDKFRYLPAQAIRGRLGGIKPTYGDWHAEDCVLFRALTEEKQLVAIVMGETEVEAKDKQLIVKLVDTSDPNNDVYIHHVLLNEGMAKCDT